MKKVVNIHTEKLIDLIKARPALYDKNLLSYTDRQLKRKLWSEICELMTPGWIHHSISAKSQIGIKVQKHWQDIKTAFQKEFNLEKMGQLVGGHSNKRKKYDHLDKLSFLIPTMNLPLPPSNSTQGQGHAEMQAEMPSTINVSPAHISTTSNSHSTGHESGPIHKSTRRKLPVREPYFKIFNVQSNKGIDEDKYFLLSLVPSLQKMSSAQKIRVKMMFLRAIHDIEEEIQQAKSCPQLDGNEISYDRPCQCASPAPYTTTSDNFCDPSNQPSVIQSSPRPMQSTQNPKTQETNENRLSAPAVWVKDSSVLIAQPPPQPLDIIKEEIIIYD